MYWLKRLSINLIALALATFIGMVAVSQAVYVFDANVGRLPIAPFIRGFVASLIVAAIAPKTAFLPRFLVFSGIFLADLLLSIIISNMTIVMLDRYWGGNQDGAGLWMYGVGLIPIVTCVVGYLVLRGFRSPPETGEANAVGSQASM
ncbi:hypothetical protein [Mesorhizobium sp.]|uniref:hypothetical protein n=1 Tax=Mesorhizobium sp. TaxID=1871066 RepID=UPI000FE55F71|nr:hypothetical protein [Mesorhizobium sp.]RWM20406.1 MAG: hypothetical protein EOR73_15415 [Mesorhizobium sp.]TIP69384.1 MAG: hypothetical protein E5X55_32595 [Mesorhizobium sp.]TIQ03337.1 MAG: hypothetical protein E5X57_31025 [Mesorhizobium sp.]TJV93092.1 MAG: hypothetical protein E5X52_32290 [Mesorhizobium sp.]